MRIFWVDKFLIRHFVFFYTEIKSAILKKQVVSGNFKFFKILYVRFLINYIESFNYYMSKFFTDNKKTNSENSTLQIQRDGIQFLENLNINSLDFIVYNDQKIENTAVTTNEIDFNKGELFCKKSNFFELAKNYLGVSECNLFIHSWNTYSYTKEFQVKTNLWHRDRDGIKLCKIFIYLTDVTNKCGGHFYIKGSHKKKPLRFVPQFRFKDEIVKKNFNNSNIIEVLGDAGTCFFEDTTGLHRGSKPENGNKRSILSFTFFTGPLLPDQNCKIVNLGEF